MDLRYWSEASVSLLRNLAADVRARGTTGFVKRVLRSGLEFEALPAISEITLFDLLGVSEIEIDLGRVSYSPSNVNPVELFCLKALVRHVRAQRIFEIGTFDGATTVELAKAAPQAEVFTLDLPSELAEMANVPSEAASAKDKRVGSRFRHLPEAQRITQVLGDSLRFDYAPFAASIDLVFVDAAHDYEHVSVDSRNALEIMKPGGTAIWHDYVAGWPGVVRAVDELARKFAIRRITGTSLAVLIP
jgi:predicted O-methyltransferase YrrM